MIDVHVHSPPHYSMMTETMYFHAALFFPTEIPMQLTSLLSNKTELSEWMTSLNLTQDIIQEVMTAQLNNEKVV